MCIYNGFVRSHSAYSTLSPPVITRERTCFYSLTHAYNPHTRAQVAKALLETIRERSLCGVVHASLLVSPFKPLILRRHHVGQIYFFLLGGA
jgi:hypothetical protein